MSVYAQIIHFAEAVGRTRALTDQESLWLEDAIRLDAHQRGASRSPRRPQRPWQIADVRKLKRFLQMGKPVPEFAPVLGRTAPAIHRKMRKLGLRCGQSSVAPDGAEG